MELKLRFRDLREDRDLSQTQIAKMLNCSQQTYSRYESHTTEIPLESLIVLAQFYKTSVDYLLGITNVSEPYPKK
ncbi:Helix-turn-helix [Ruminococcaceae bacterium FB2012]|nr:Helix-turn-helix [Ruminococcaceae bacterium FB2012]